MYRAALRTASRQTLRGLRAQTSRQAPRRLASSASSPADRPRSWKSSALRWGLAVAAVYYYNTSPVFSEAAAEPEDKEEARSKVAAPSSFAESDLPTVEAVVEKKRQQLEEAKSARKEKEQPKTSEDKEADSAAPETKSAASETESDAEPQTAETEEPGQEAAFNPETGEINWDCPCLGGMAHGPCGDEFKTAFSCFVYSTEEPKGMDCIDKFQGMQECFRQYPDVYGAELSDDDEVPQDEVPETPSAPGEEPASDSPKADTPKEETPIKEQPVAAADGVPKKWEDAADAGPKEAQKEQPGKKEKDE